MQKNITKSYEKTNWIAKKTVISADLLNKIEDKLLDLDLNLANKAELNDTDKVDYMGGKHETLKETSDANVEYLLRKVNTQKYENSNIVANNSYAKQISNAILKGVTKYRDRDTGDILEEFDNSKNLELVSVKNPTLLITNKIEGISRGLIEMLDKADGGLPCLVDKIDNSNFTIKTTGKRATGVISSQFFTQSMNMEYGTNYVIEFDGKLLKGDLDTAEGVMLSSWSSFVQGYDGKLPIDGKYRAVITSTTNPAASRRTYFYIYTTNHVTMSKEVEYQVRNLKVYPVNNNDETYKSSKINITGEYRSIGQLSDTLDLNTGEIIQCTEVMDINKIPDNEFGDFSINGVNGVTPNTCNINIHKAVLHKYFPKYSTKVLPMSNFKKCEGTTFGKDYECIALHDDEMETLQINLSHERFNGELTKQKAIEIVKSLNIKLIYPLKESIKKKINIDERLYSYDGTTYFTCISSSEYLPPILAIEIPTDISSLISDQEIEIQKLKNENEKLKQMDNELIANSWDIDFRTCEIEWALEDAGLTKITLMNEVNNKKTNLSRYEQAKVIIIKHVYEYELLAKQLSRYLEKNIITQDEYNELIALMEENE